jgi:hypothetical protein
MQGGIAGLSRLTYDRLKAVRIPEGPAMSRSDHPDTTGEGRQALDNHHAGLIVSPAR